MKICYVANAFGHISGPLCDELYNVYKDDFTFLATDELSEDRKKVGSGAEREFVVYSKDDEMKAQKLCDDADVVIFGSAPLKYIENRIKYNKFTIYYSERLFKNGYWRYFNPITMSHVKKRFKDPAKNSNFYLLCASSFAALDFNRIGAFKNKMYKWGYQPAIEEKNIDALLDEKAEDGLDFIWVGRLVGLKHCDHAIKVISMLKKEGYNPRMKVIGTGEEEENLKALAKSLNIENEVHFLGRCPIEETRHLMDTANIFMFTSDFGEGWGATLNECMNSGVACVASHGAGATYFLTKDNENGLIYKSGDIDMLFKKVKSLIDNKEYREKLAKAGYESIYNQWNTVYSHKRFIKLIEELKEKGSCDLYKDGPCSKAEPIKHNWY